MSSLNEIWAQRAVKILRKEIKNIKNVNGWAKAVGHSRAWLGSYIKNVYGVTPKNMLKSIRFKKIVHTIRSRPNSTSYSVALEAGLKNEKSLYKFLKTHFDTTFTQLRVKIISKTPS